MKRLTPLLLLLCWLQPLLAQMVQPFNLVTLPAGGKVIRWYGYAGRSYFVQVSDPSTHLRKWTWAPIIEGGNNAEISYEVDGTPDKGFFRLKYTDQVPGSGKTLDTADFDGDGISNLDEISAVPSTDPLNPDTDSDGMPDGWELAHGFNPFNGSDAALDADGDGLSNAGEYQSGTNPNNLDSDGDGVSDINEVRLGTNPNDPNDTPVEKFFWLSTKVSSELDNFDWYTMLCSGGSSQDMQDALDNGNYVNHKFSLESFLPGRSSSAYGYTNIPIEPHTQTMFDQLWARADVPGYATFPTAVNNPDLSQAGWTPDPAAICVGRTLWNKDFYNFWPVGSNSDDLPIVFTYTIFESYRSKVKLASSFIQDTDRTFHFLKVETRTPRATTSVPNPPPEVLRTASVEVVIPKGKNVSNTPTINGHEVGEGDEVGVFKTTLADELEDTAVEVKLVPVEVVEVSFGGTKYWELKSDDAATIYAAPQWKDVDGNGKPTNAALGERDYAVAFTRNTKPQICAKFKIASPSNFGAIKIKATGPDGVAISETAATVSGDEVTMPLTEASSAMVNTIKFYDKKDEAKAFKLKWEIKIGDSAWAEITTTKHTVYVMLNDPVTPLRQETLFYLSCKNADGVNQQADVTNAIWNEFTDRDVRRVDNTIMTYYKNYHTQNTETAQLLKLEDGQCGAWVKFFIDLRRVQGINDQPWRSLTAKTPASGLIVNDWDFAGQGTSGVADFPFFNMPGAPNHVGDTSYNWKFAEVSDQAGIPGQGGVANPASMFERHSAVFINGEYFDPSYGVKYATLADIENAFAGFYQHPGGQYPGYTLVDEAAVNLDLNGNGNKTDSAVSTWTIIFRKNLPGMDITETLENY